MFPQARSTTYREPPRRFVTPSDVAGEPVTASGRRYAKCIVRARAWSTQAGVGSRNRPARRRAAAQVTKGKGLSVAAIAAHLNAEGHRNRTGREWSPQMVHHVLGPNERLLVRQPLHPPRNCVVATAASIRTTH